MRREVNGMCSVKKHRLTALAVAFVLLLSNISAFAALSFFDVRQDSWYYDSVAFNAEKGYVAGFADGSFGPEQSLQRQDFVVILSKVFEADVSSYAHKANAKLADIHPNGYYAAAVNWAVDKGIISGYENGKFGVGDYITREQIATILYRCVGMPEVGSESDFLSAFKDSNSVSTFAAKPMAWAVQNEIIAGSADKRLMSRSFATRAQICAIIMRVDSRGMVQGIIARLNATETVVNPPAPVVRKYYFRNANLLKEHYGKHGSEVGAVSETDYLNKANAVINNSNALHKNEKEDNDDIYYLTSTGEIVFVSVDGFIRTYFIASLAYYNKQ